MKASLVNYRQSPRKVRLVGDLIKGKSVATALVELSFLPKRAALPIEKLLRSALANAKQSGVSEDGLVVASVRVDKGLVIKRRMPRARGMATPINKRTSHVEITLKVGEPKKKGKSKKAVATTETAKSPKEKAKIAKK